jgi:polar amino acid transport system substrate-binding protein
MIRTLIVFIMSLCLAQSLWARCEGYLPQEKPQNASRDIVGADLDTILERGYIEFAAYEDFAPWSFEQNGKPVGIDVDLAHLIAADLGVEAKIRLVAAGETLDADLRNWVWKGPVVGGRVANVMMHVPYDSEFACRVEQVTFTGIYHVESIAIAYDKASYPDEKPVPAYFRFDTVGVENDSIADFYITQLIGSQAAANIRRYPSTALAMDALSKGDVMAVMGPTAQLEYGLTDSADVHQPPLPAFSVGKWTVGVGIHFAYKPLGYAVDDIIFAALNDGRLQTIFSNYGVTLSPPELR